MGGRPAPGGAALGLAVMAVAPSVHDAVTRRLAQVEQRYTPQRRALVEVLAGSPRPLTVPEIVAAAPQLPQSSAYRTITVLTEAGVVRRVAGADDHGRFELAEEISGHHHHLVCMACGRVEDVAPSPRLELALRDMADTVAGEQGFVIDEHRLDLVGVCADCRAAR